MIIERFGDRLRRFRMSAGVSMGQLARHLGIAATYLSAVENSKRPPLSKERIRQAAAFIDCDPGPLLLLASLDRNRATLSVPDSEIGRECLVVLMRGWDQATDDEYEVIKTVLVSLFDKSCPCGQGVEETMEKYRKECRELAEKLIRELGVDGLKQGREQLYWELFSKEWDPEEDIQYQIYTQVLEEERARTQGQR